MLPVDEESKQRLVADLGKLITFSSDLGNKQLWNEARIALGELGDTSSRLLAGNTREDLALSASLSELDESVEALRNSYGREDANRQFELSLGDVEYRVKRLFGVSVR